MLMPTFSYQVRDEAGHLVKGLLEAVTHEIESGASLSQALGHHSKIFPEMMVSLVAVGETAGKLDLVLGRFAHFLEKDLAFRREVRGSLLYPSLLFVACLILILFVVGFVVPQFAAIFVKAGIPLPAPTLILQGIGQVIRGQGWVLAIAGVVVAMSGGWIYRQPQVRLKVDARLLKLPGSGPLLLAATIARFSRTLATLVASGVPILSALRNAQGVVFNRALAREIERVGQAVERGERIASTLSVGGLFTADAIQMIRVGEESGRLEVMLEKLADFYELRLNYALKQMTTLLEPILLVAMGAVVAFIMASLLLPMFDMVQVLQRGGIR